ncbi:MAG: ArsB/NhaD family transporter [Thermoplasmata archaeon]|nr:MAG: ArsB/NhaD family transporter [Thermoplasmata archaeon]
MIITGYLHSTVAALFGATLIIIAMKIFGTGFDTLFEGEGEGIITFTTIIETIGLLMGMMIMVGILSKTGFFQWMALKSYEIAEGEPWKLMLMLILMTAFLSAFLDNVTTVLLMVPATIELARVLKINPIPMLISEALASNIGGTATVIGDPPNIMIGAAFQLSFMSFIINVAPIILLNMVVFILMIKIFYKGKLGEPEKLEEMETLREKYAIKDMKLFKRSIFIFCIVIILFLIHDFIGISLAESALFGAVLLLLLSGVDIHEALESVEWTTLLFFAALFVLIVGAIELGLIQVIADGTLNLIGGNPVLAIVLIIWVTAITSSIIGAIPTTAIMIPIVSTLSLSLDDLGSIGGATTLYWALCLGQGLGGNATPIGHAASIVVVGVSERTEYAVTFKEFMKIGLPVMIITSFLSTMYLLLRYVAI